MLAFVYVFIESRGGVLVKWQLSSDDDQVIRGDIHSIFGDLTFMILIIPTGYGKYQYNAFEFVFGSTESQQTFQIVSEPDGLLQVISILRLTSLENCTELVRSKNSLQGQLDEYFQSDTSCPIFLLGCATTPSKCNARPLRNPWSPCTKLTKCPD